MLILLLLFNIKLLISISFKGLAREGEKSLVSHKHLIIQMKKLQWELEGYKLFLKLVLSLIELTLLLKQCIES